MTQFFSTDARKLAETVVQRARAAGLKIATAESCTGGLVAGAMTSVSGASNVFEYGYVTYANAAKQKILGVGENTLCTHGAVSPDTAKEMAEGARAHSGANIALSVTGIAGPDGGSAKKPVGLVFFGISTQNGTCAIRHVFSGGRDDVRAAAVLTGLGLLLDAVTGQGA